MTVLLTGVDGYIGFPLCLNVLEEYPGKEFIGVDNFSRRERVKEQGSVSALELMKPQKRFKQLKEQHSNFDFRKVDLKNRGKVKKLFETENIDSVLHLAAQPSGPYSQKSLEKANFTHRNNNQATRNLIWSLKDSGSENTKFITTTTMGVYGSPRTKIAEGETKFSRKGIKEKLDPNNKAGSWYHITKTHDINNLRLAQKQFGLNVLDFRTAVVYGTKTKRLEQDEFNTRLDFDSYFGTVVNRFCCQAVIGHPITVYGKGKQVKPFVSLQETVDSLSAALENDSKGYTTYNQTTTQLSILDLAEEVRKTALEKGRETDLIHLENPRKEKEEAGMEVETSNFEEILPQKTNFRNRLDQMLEDLSENEEKLENHKEKFIPETKE